LINLIRGIGLDKKPHLNHSKLKRSTPDSLIGMTKAINESKVDEIV